jgi:hypothetical protein
MTNEKQNQRYNDLIGDILKQHTEEGGMANLKGFGKPLSEDYFSGDTFQHFQKIAKDAGYKPYWLKLQHEISIELQSISNLLQSDPTTDMTNRIDRLNEKVGEHNKSCPPPLLKGRISIDKLENSLMQWK